MRSTRPDISVVVPFLNEADRIVEQLDALRRQGDPRFTWELVLVDNGSTDGSTERVARWIALTGHRARIVDASKRSGVSYARNEGIRVSSGEWVALCDADDLVVDGWLRAFWEAAQSEDADIFGGSLIRLNLHDEGARGSEVMRPGTTSLSRSLGFLEFAPGGNQMFRRKVWEEIGGFDESWTPLGGEDHCFSLDAQLAGFRIAFVVDATVVYRPRSTLLASLARTFSWAQSRAYLFKRYRQAGARRRRFRGVVWSWMGIAASSWRFFGPKGIRNAWLNLFARNLGFIVGSVKARVLYP